MFEPPAKAPLTDPKTPTRTDPFLEALKSTDAQERNKAVAALAEMARGVADAVPALTERLNKDDDPGVRSAAAQALGLLGPQARTAYSDLIHVSRTDNHESVREAAAAAIDQISKPTLTVEQLVKAFKSKDEDERNKAVESLSEMARGVADAVPGLTERMLNDDDARIRVMFASVLGSLGPQARSAYPALLHIQHNDGNKSVQEAATTALERMGKPSSSDVPFIVKGLRDKSPDFRSSVAQTLSLICTAANKSAVPLLRDALTDDDPRVQALCRAGIVVYKPPAP